MMVCEKGKQEKCSEVFIEEPRPRAAVVANGLCAPGWRKKRGRDELAWVAASIKTTPCSTGMKTRLTKTPHCILACQRRELVEP